MLLLILRVPDFAVRLRDELEDVRAVLLPDVPEPLLVRGRPRVVEAERLEVLRAVHELDRARPDQPLHEPGRRGLRVRFPRSVHTLFNLISTGALLPRDFTERGAFLFKRPPGKKYFFR